MNYDLLNWTMIVACVWFVIDISWTIAHWND